MSTRLRRRASTGWVPQLTARKPFAVAGAVAATVLISAASAAAVTTPVHAVQGPGTLIVQPGPTSEGMYPGGPKLALTYLVTNTGDLPVVTSRAALTGINAIRSTGVCTAAAVALQSGVPDKVVIPAGATRSVTLPKAIGMTRQAENGCAGAEFDVSTTISAILAPQD